MIALIVEFIRKDWLTAGLLATLVVGLLAALKSRNRHLKLPPGPPGFPIIGHILSIFKDPHFIFQEFHKKYGPVFQIRLGLKSAVVIGDFSVIKDVYKNVNDRAEEVMSLTAETHTFLELNGKDWQDHRKSVSSALRATNRESFTESLIQNAVSSLMTKIERVSSNKETSVTDVISDFTVNVSYSLSTGKNFDEDDKITQLLSSWNNRVRIRFMWLPLAEAFNIPTWISEACFPPMRSLGKISRILDKVIQVEIESHKEVLDEENVTGLIDHILVNKAKAVSGSNEKLYNDKTIRGNVMLLMLAASDTTRITLEWVLLWLTKYQDVQEKMYREILSVVGENRAIHSDRPTLPYTEAVIMESSRMTTTLPLNLTRKAPHDLVINGFDVPKGTWIIGNHYAVHNDPKLWSNPSTFDPNRFLSSDGQKIVVPEHWIPFSMGNRNCIGDKVAKMVLFLAVTTIVQNFKILPPNRGLSMAGEMIITYSATSPYVKFEKRILK